MKEYNVHEVLSILQKYYITDSQQMVTRWIREGRLIGVRSEYRKEGYRVSEDDLFDFIEEKCPGLPSIMDVYERYIKDLEPEEVQVIEKTDSPELKVQSISSENNESFDQLDELKQESYDLKKVIQSIEELNENLVMMRQSLITEINEVRSAVDKYSNEHHTIDSTGEVNENQKVGSVTKYQEFIDLAEELNIEEEAIDSRLNELYKHIFDDDGKVKPEHIQNNQYHCPYSSKHYKHQKRFLKKVINEFFKS